MSIAVDLFAPHTEPVVVEGDSLSLKLWRDFYQPRNAQGCFKRC